MSGGLPLFLVRSAHQVARYRPRAPIIAVTRNPQTARQAHLYRGIFPVLCKDPVQDAWAEDVDLRVNLAMNVGTWRGLSLEGCLRRELRGVFSKSSLVSECPVRTRAGKWSSVALLVL